MWNVTTQQKLLVDRRLDGSLTNLPFSPDGRLLLGSNRTAVRAGGLQVYRAPLFSEMVAPLRRE